MTRKTVSMLILIACLTAWIRCSTSTGPKETKGFIQGTVKSAGMLPLHPAYLSSGDSLLATTDEQGKYTIASNQEGDVALVCFAQDYKDTTVQVQVTAGKTTPMDFILNPGQTIGRVFGEFQDDYLFHQVLKTDSSMKNWNAKQIWDGETGATLCYKFVRLDLSGCTVFLNDSLVAVDDGWGQFYLNIPCGKYRFKGFCEGYGDVENEIMVLPGVINHMIFFLPRTTLGQ